MTPSPGLLSRVARAYSSFTCSVVFVFFHLQNMLPTSCYTYLSGGVEQLRKGLAKKDVAFPCWVALTFLCVSFSWLRCDFELLLHACCRNAYSGAIRTNFPWLRLLLASVVPACPTHIPYVVSSPFPSPRCSMQNDSNSMLRNLQLTV